MPLPQGLQSFAPVWKIEKRSTEKKVFFISTIRVFTIHSKIVEKDHMAPVLVVMLEVMSRMTPAMLGSDFSSSSTLRMDERTVA